MSATIHPLHAECAEHESEPTPALPPPEDYAERVRALHETALARSELPDFVDACAQALAWVVFSFDRPGVTADVFAKFAAHLDVYAERQRAEQELAELARNGGKTN